MIAESINSRSCLDAGYLDPIVCRYRHIDLRGALVELMSIVALIF